VALSKDFLMRPTDWAVATEAFTQHAHTSAKAREEEEFMKDEIIIAEGVPLGSGYSDNSRFIQEEAAKYRKVTESEPPT